METKSMEEELTVLGKHRPFLRCKDPKCYTVWYNLCGWVSKKRLERSGKAFGRSGTDDRSQRLGGIWRGQMQQHDRGGETGMNMSTCGWDQIKEVSNPCLRSSGPHCGLCHLNL